MDEYYFEKKSFLKRHKTSIIVASGIVISTALLMVYLQVYKKAFIRGGIVGFHTTIDWFDKTFKDVNLRELYNAWAELNPEQIVYI